MSHFYGNMKGNRGEITRCGAKSSGLHPHVRVWEVGVRVICNYNESEGKDEIYVYKTTGSSGYGPEELICSVTKENIYPAD